MPFALGSKERTENLFVCLGRETGCNSFRPPAVSEPVRKVQVSITTLDRYLERAGDIDKVDFIKIDIEGAELEALRGASGLLSHSKPLTLCELADVRTQPLGIPECGDLRIPGSTGLSMVFNYARGPIATLRKEGALS